MAVTSITSNDVSSLIISPGSTIEAADIFKKFKDEISADLTEIATGISTLTSQLSISNNIDYRYFTNLYPDTSTSSVIEQLMETLKTVQNTVNWSTSPLPRHLQTTFVSGTEASGQVAKGDFIGAYHARHFIESLYALASNIRNIKCSFKHGSGQITEVDTINAFNNFALRSNESDTSAYADGTVFNDEASDKHWLKPYYINLNTNQDANALIGRQVVSLLTSTVEGDNAKIQPKDPSAISLNDFYDVAPSDWTVSSNTGITKEYTTLTGINIDDPSGIYVPDTVNIGQRISSYYEDTVVKDKIRSKTTALGSKHIVTAKTVNDLITECHRLLGAIKTDLYGLYTHNESQDTNPVAEPFIGLASLGFPFNKSWFFTRWTGYKSKDGVNLSSQTTADIGARGTGPDNTTLLNALTDITSPLLVAPNITAVNGKDSIPKADSEPFFALSNKHYAMAERWDTHINALRVGYKPTTDQSKVTADYHCGIPLTIQDINRSTPITNGTDISNYCGALPRNLPNYNNTNYKNYINLKTYDASAPYKYFNRVCLSWPDWNDGRSTSDVSAQISSYNDYNIRKYYAFCNSYANIVSALNTGIVNTGKYNGLCVISAVKAFSDISSLATNADDAKDNKYKVVNFAIGKKPLENNNISIITSDADLPNNIGITITAWTSINEVNFSRGTTATTHTGFNTSVTSFTMAKYDRGHKTPAITTWNSSLGVNLKLIIDHVNSYTAIPEYFGEALFKFRNKHAVLYGPADVLASKSYNENEQGNTGIINSIKSVLAVGAANKFFQGCAGGVAKLTYVFNKNNNYYGGVETVPAIILNSKISANLLYNNPTEESWGDYHRRQGVSQGYFGYDGFNFSYDVNTTSSKSVAISSIQNNLLAWVPLPSDDAKSQTALPAETDTRYKIKIAATNWWDAVYKADLIPTNISATDVSSINIDPITDLSGIISTNINISAGVPLTSIINKVKLYNKLTTSNLSCAYIITELTETDNSTPYQIEFNVQHIENCQVPSPKIVYNTKENIELPVLSFDVSSNIQFDGWTDVSGGSITYPYVVSASVQTPISVFNINELSSDISAGIYKLTAVTSTVSS